MYQVIQPPFTLKFQEMPKREVKGYAEWFHEIMPQRIQELAKAVKSSSGFEDWEPDETPESLERLGHWFRQEVETRKRTSAEVEEIGEGLSFPIDIPDEELTNRSFSLAMDVGMYFGNVILKNLPNCRWDQPTKNKTYADYGQPVLMGFGSMPLNPVRIAVTLAYAFAAEEQPGERLKGLYDFWSKRAC